MKIKTKRFKTTVSEFSFGRMELFTKAVIAKRKYLEEMYPNYVIKEKSKKHKTTFIVYKERAPA